VGGGVSGMTAALDLAKKGFDVILIEKQDKLGGRLNELHNVFPTMNSAQEIVDDLIARVEKEKRIKVYLNTKVLGRDGAYGNYEIQVEDVNTQERAVHTIGTMVLTVGLDTYDPKVGEFGWETVPQVISTLDLEKKFRNGELKKPPKNPVFIHCVGSRENPGEGNRYCSRVCCSAVISIQHELSERYSQRIRKISDHSPVEWRKCGVRIDRTELRTSDGTVRDLSQ